MDWIKELGVLPVDHGAIGSIRWAVCPHPDLVARNGYIHLPDGHPWLTDERVRRDACPSDLTYDDTHWLGFDTRHVWDRWPSDAPTPWDAEKHTWSVAEVIQVTKHWAEAAWLASQQAKEA